MIYLDYNAKAPLLPEARQAMLEALDYLGNPSSVHGDGRLNRKLLEKARNDMATRVNTHPHDIIFTSGASESNAQVMQTWLNKDMDIWISAIEHPSIHEAAIQHHRPIHILPVDRDGVLNLDQLEQQLSSSLAVLKAVTVMAANNETGVIQPITDIRRIAKKYGALFHVDATQALGRIPVDVQEWQADYVSASSHKIGGPLGAGMIIARKGFPLDPLIHGGGQEQSRRAGSQNVPAIVGFAAALNTMASFDWQDIQNLRDTLEQSLLSFYSTIKIFGHQAPRLANTSCLHMPGVTNQTQVIGFDLAGLALSAGSACSSGKVKPSTVLKAMGYNDNMAQQAIRVSLCPTTTEKDIKAFIQTWLSIKQRADAQYDNLAA